MRGMLTYRTVIERDQVDFFKNQPGGLPPEIRIGWIHERYREEDHAHQNQQIYPKHREKEQE